MYVKKVQSTNGNNIWGWAIGTTTNDYGYAIKERPDGGFVAVGMTFNSYVDIYFVLLNSDGTNELGLAIGGSDIEYGYDVEVTNDSSYVIAGITSSYGSGSYDGYIRKQDTAGAGVWSNAIGGAAYDRFNAIVENEHGQLIICGYTNSFGAGGHDLWLTKCDASGSVIWSWVFGGANSEIGNDLFIGDDNCIYATGIVYFSNDDQDVLMVKFTPDGTACLGYYLGTGSDAVELTGNDPYFTASRIDHVNSEFINDTETVLDLKVTPMKGGLIDFKSTSRIQTSITPTVTTICN
jgi:hypothetical protein